MNVIIVGGGFTGVYLANLLLKSHCSVKVIENRSNVFEKLQKDLSEEYIVNGSGTDPDLLESVGISASDVFVSVTDQDEVNLVASTIAKFEFGVPRVIARVNNPKNAWMFNASLGVDNAINQADLMAHLILEGIDMKNMMTLLRINRGGASIVQVSVAPGAKAVGKPIRDLGIPEKAVIITVFRGKESIIPRGDTMIQEGDDVLALADEKTQPILEKLFIS
jgi:K+ transport systems, NAD-binding component